MLSVRVRWVCMPSSWIIAKSPSLVSTMSWTCCPNHWLGISHKLSLPMCFLHRVYLCWHGAFLERDNVTSWYELSPLNFRFQSVLREAKFKGNYEICSLKSICFIMYNLLFNNLANFYKAYSPNHLHLGFELFELAFFSSLRQFAWASTGI